jgi:hypothetical protein
MFEFVSFQDLYNYPVSSEDEVIDRIDNPTTDEEEE